MLKIYNTLEEVPEALREHYKKSDGRYVPDLSEDHPVVVHNKQLLSEKSTATAKVRELEADAEEMKKTSVPRGHVAIAKADVEKLNAFNALGKTPEELKTISTEHGTLKETEDRRQREDKQRLVAKELGFENADAFVLLADLPDFDIREKDGKKSVIALVKDGEKIVEKPAMEFLESSPRHAPLLPALKAQNSGVTVHGTSSDSSKPTEPFAWAKTFADNYNKQNQPAGNLATAFYERKSA